MRGQGLSMAFVVITMSFAWFLVVPTVTLFFGQPQCKSSLDREPAVVLPPNHTLAPATWTMVSNFRYDVWEALGPGSSIRYSVVSDPATAAIVRDPESMKNVYAVQLVCEMANVVYTVGRQTDPLVEVGSMVDTALAVADFGDAGRTQLTQFRKMLDEKEAPALAISSIVSGSKEQAKQMVLSRSDVEAEGFLKALLIAELTAVSKAAFLVSIVAWTAELVGIDTKGWLNELYNYVAQGGMPLLEIISSTYGSFEASRTLDFLGPT